MSTKLTAGLTLAVAIVATLVSVAGAEPQANSTRGVREAEGDG